VAFEIARPIRRILAAAAVLAMLGILASARPAVAASGLNQPVGLIPASGSNGNAGSYFVLGVAPGRSVTASAFISNPGQAARELKISRSTGGTAANGGTTFTRAFQPCSGVGCWVTGLPRAVTLPPGTGERLQFRVSVPPGTGPGQYLAGITAEVAAAPSPTKVVVSGKATGKVNIIEQVTVAVAVTVGPVSALTTRLTIPGVSATSIGPTLRLNIGLKNTGQTFAHGAGNGYCVAAGQRHRFAVFAPTVLPHDQALIAANVPGVPGGATMSCTVRLGYAHGRVATWSGLVTVPDASTSRIVHTGLGAYSVVPAPGAPGWATALIVIAVLLAAAVAVLLVRARATNTKQQFKHRE
jgi:hypothetical protein